MIQGSDQPPVQLETKRAVEQAACTEAETAQLRVNTILESITDAFFALDLEWRITYANRHVEALLQKVQRTRTALLGRNLWEEFPEFLGTRTHQEFLRAMSEGIPVEYEDFFPPLRLWVEVKAYPSPEGLSVYFRDFTRRRIGESALRFLARAGEILATSLDSQVTLQNVARLIVPRLADWCLIDLVRDHTIERVCVAAADPAKEAILQEIRQRFPPQWDSPRPSARALRTQAPFLAHSQTPDFLAGLFTNPDHLRLVEQLQPIAVLALPMQTRGQILGAITFCCGESGRTYSETEVALALELTQRAALAIDNARLYREAQEAVRAQKELDELKDMFVSIASHELRAPLSAMIGYIELALLQLTKLEGKIPDDASGTALTNFVRYLKTALVRGARMRELIEELFHFSRLHNNQLVPQRTEGVNLTALVQHVVAQYQVSKPERAVQVQAMPEPLIGTVDEGQVEQVVGNLLSNAFKYSPLDTLVTVGIGRLPEQGPAREALIWVQDHGVGISAEHQAHIFDRFYRASTKDTPQTEGLGLGLYISAAIVQQHGGRIWVESTPGAGSAFYVALPLT